jgi:hypothetical protein
MRNGPFETGGVQFVPEGDQETLLTIEGCIGLNE